MNSWSNCDVTFLKERRLGNVTSFNIGLRYTALSASYFPQNEVIGTLFMNILLGILIDCEFLSVYIEDVNEITRFIKNFLKMS